jgi:hypothetical protein
MEFTTGAVAPQPVRNRPPKTSKTGSQNEEKDLAFTGVEVVMM